MTLKLISVLIYILIVICSTSTEGGNEGDQKNADNAKTKTLNLTQHEKLLELNTKLLTEMSRSLNAMSKFFTMNNDDEAQSISQMLENKIGKIINQRDRRDVSEESKSSKKHMFTSVDLIVCDTVKDYCQKISEFTPKQKEISCYDRNIPIEFDITEGQLSEYSDGFLSKRGIQDSPNRTSICRFIRRYDITDEDEIIVIGDKIQRVKSNDSAKFIDEELFKSSYYLWFLNKFNLYDFENESIYVSLTIQKTVFVVSSTWFISIIGKVLIRWIIILVNILKKAAIDETSLKSTKKKRG